MVHAGALGQACSQRVLTDRTYETPSLWTVDPETIGHVLSHSYNYEKPMEGRRTTARLIGKSEQRTSQLVIWSLDGL